MARNLWEGLFVNCYCEDCRYSEFDKDREQFYCRLNHNYYDLDDSKPCSKYERK